MFYLLANGSFSGMELLFVLGLLVSGRGFRLMGGDKGDKVEARSCGND